MTYDSRDDFETDALTKPTDTRHQSRSSIITRQHIISMQQTAHPVQIQKYLSGLSYPATRDKIIAHAESQGATPEIITMLRAIDDREYGGPTELSEEIGSEE